MNLLQKKIRVFLAKPCRDSETVDRLVARGLLDPGDEIDNGTALALMEVLHLLDFPIDADEYCDFMERSFNDRRANAIIEMDL